MDWEECNKKRIVKDVSEDLDFISSLIKTSEDKLISADKLTTDEITSASKLSLTYDSLRELLEALSLKQGYKIYNHECYVSFLKEILNESEKGDEFDEIRKIRNNINYYGKTISVEEAEDVIKRIKKLRNYVKMLLNKTTTFINPYD